MESTQLQTQRLHLKGISPQLIHHFFNSRDDAAIIDYFGCDAAGFEKLKRMHEEGMETHRSSLYYFLIVNQEDNRIMGECGFHSWNKTHRRAEVFYHLREDSDKGKGYVTEALRAVLDFGFAQMQLNRIEALVADWNIPSVKLLQRYKFTKEGRMREHYLVNDTLEDSDCYALLKREWQTENP